MKTMVKFCAASALMLAAFSSAAMTAQAATQIGSTCQANVADGGPVLNLGHSTPAAGVITSWGINLSPLLPPPPSSTQHLLVLSRMGVHSWKVNWLSDPLTMVNTFSQPTRIPIPAGNRIGVWGGGGWTFTCLTPGGGSDFEYASLATPPKYGGGFTSTPGAEETAAVWANVEPDIDGDAFGDETQDLCPASALFDRACPAPATKPQISVSRAGVTLTFTAEVETALTLAGSVKLPSGRGKVTLKRTTTLPMDEERKVKLVFPAKLKNARKALPRSKALKLSLKITGAALGKTAVKNLTVKLKGLK